MTTDISTLNLSTAHLPVSAADQEPVRLLQMSEGRPPPQNVPKQQQKVAAPPAMRPTAPSPLPYVIPDDSPKYIIFPTQRIEIMARNMGVTFTHAQLSLVIANDLTFQLRKFVEEAKRRARQQRMKKIVSLCGISAAKIPRESSAPEMVRDFRPSLIPEIYLSNKQVPVSKSSRVDVGAGRSGTITRSIATLPPLNSPLPAAEVSTVCRRRVNLRIRRSKVILTERIFERLANDYQFDISEVNLGSLAHISEQTYFYIVPALLRQDLDN